MSDAATFPLSARGNTTAFAQCVGVAREFGARYKQRVDLSVTMFIIINVALLVLLVMGLADCSASLLFVYQVGIGFSYLAVLIAVILKLAADVAEQLHLDPIACCKERLLIAHALSMRQGGRGDADHEAAAQNTATDCAGAHDLTPVLRELDAAECLLEQSRIAKPVAILGIEAGETLTRALVTVFASAVPVVAGMIDKCVNDNGPGLSCGRLSSGCCGCS